MCVVDYAVSTFSSNYIKNDLEPSLLSLRAFFALSLFKALPLLRIVVHAYFLIFPRHDGYSQTSQIMHTQQLARFKGMSASLPSVDQALMFGPILL